MREAMPPADQGAAVPGAALTTTHDRIFAWARSAGVRPVRLGLACCAVEMTTAVAAGDTGAGLLAAPRAAGGPPAAPPATSDVLIVAGTVSEKLVPWLRGLWEQMPEPKWVVAVGACASCGGPFPTYAVTQGIDRVLPVAVYVPGCPPSPEALLLGLMHLAQKIEREGRRR